MVSDRIEIPLWTLQLLVQPRDLLSQELQESVKTRLSGSLIDELKPRAAASLTFKISILGHLSSESLTHGSHG